MIPGIAGYEAIGEHDISVIQTCSNATHTESIEESFKITIEEPAAIPTEAEIMVKALEAQGEVVHNYEVKNSTEMEEFHPD